MVFGHNLHHMAPFGILEAGFCMVFRPASLCFWPRGWIVGPRDQNLDPGFPNWARAGLGRLSGQNNGLENAVLLGNGLQIGDNGISRDPNALNGTQEVFGRGGFLPNPPKKCSSPLFPILGKLGRVP